MRNKNKPLTKAIFDNFAGSSQKPIYDEKGNVIKYNKSRFSRFNWKPLVIIASFLLIICGLLYLPQLFMHDDLRGEFIMTPNAAGYTQMQKHLENNKGEDFDSDGLKNLEEIEFGSDPYFSDSDRDGVIDGLDNNPLSKDKTLDNAILAQGTTRKDPYSMSGVILWPDNYDSWIHGAVIETQEGFQFTGFKGWAKFPSGAYAYQYVNGKHQLLPYRENANAWHITQDCVVVLTDNKPENTYRIRLFGHEFYMRSGIAEALNWLLPERGWITCEKMWLDDTFVNTNTNIYTTFKKTNPYSSGDIRFEKYSKSLDSLADVYQYISSGRYVLASLMSEEYGECIVEIYGFTETGNLIVADPQLKTNFGILNIEVCCSRILNSDGSVGEQGWFEFYGCGYNSFEGDMISFFGVEQKDGE